MLCACFELTHTPRQRLQQASCKGKTVPTPVHRQKPRSAERAAAPPPQFFRRHPQHFPSSSSSPPSATTAFVTDPNFHVDIWDRIKCTSPSLSFDRKSRKADTTASSSSGGSG
eukprot:312815-Rhodomonas_salina.1